MRSANKGLKNKSSESDLIDLICTRKQLDTLTVPTDFSQCEACGGVKLAHNICPSCYSQISRK